MISWPHRCHPCTHLFDDTGGLVPEDHGGGGRERPVDQTEIRVAHTAVGDTDEHLAGTRLLDVDVINQLQRLVHLLQDRGSHQSTLSHPACPAGIRRGTVHPP